jgi:hypothetical protein
MNRSCLLHLQAISGWWQVFTASHRTNCRLDSSAETMSRVASSRSSTRDEGTMSALLLHGNGHELRELARSITVTGISRHRTFHILYTE